VNINATLIGQAIAFAMFVYFCLRFVWPPIVNALREREKQIADGLESASRAEKDLELARKNATEKIREAKEQASELVAHANKRAAGIIDEARDQANEERSKILANAKTEIEQETYRAREELRASVSALAIEGAGRILQREVDRAAHADLLDDLVKQL
jgi:F-type H+-transporting ATPase subunit b